MDVGYLELSILGPLRAPLEVEDFPFKAPFRGLEGAGMPCSTQRTLCRLVKDPSSGYVARKCSVLSNKALG